MEFKSYKFAIHYHSLKKYTHKLLFSKQKLYVTSCLPSISAMPSMFEILFPFYFLFNILC